jgi:DNA polymerase III epsilon subunit-like protein
MIKTKPRTKVKLMNLPLDTETTGLFEKGASWETDYNYFPYCLSISWKFNNKTHYYLIHQEGRVVPPEATRCNGITTRMANGTTALPAKQVFDMLIRDALLCSNVIGHNIYFDISIVKANVIRVYGADSDEIIKLNEGLHKDKRLDTMWGSRKLFSKLPKLSELHQFLFKKDFATHDAMEDMLACERCYLELRKRGLM